MMPFRKAVGEYFVDIYQPLEIRLVLIKSKQTKNAAEMT